MTRVATKFTNLLVLTFFFSIQAQAGDVKMFSDNPPSASEMGNILFSKQSSAGAMQSGAVKTRSISFGKPKTKTDAVGLPIKFAYNSTDILPESKAFLDEVGKMLTMEEFNQEKMVIEGHTDASGSNRYNFYLSERRAQSVKNYLVGTYQVASNRLFVTGKGETEPLQGVSAYNGINRRVQFYKAP